MGRSDEMEKIEEGLMWYLTCEVLRAAPEMHGKLNVGDVGTKKSRAKMFLEKFMEVSPRQVGHEPIHRRRD